MKYKLEDLKYPIAIHIKTKEQWKLLRDKGVDINDTYLAERPYMLVGCGCLSAPYTGRAMSTGESYINISFEDIILKVSMIEDQWYKTTDNRWLFKYKKNGNGGINGSDTEFSKCYNSEYKTLTVNNWIGANSKYTIIKVTNMEEVYKHFPEERTELTSLPEQWCIKGYKSDPEYTILKNWRTDGDYSFSGYLMHDGYCKGGFRTLKGYWLPNKPSHVTEITFEQFKKWVLKEKEEPIMNTYGLKIGDSLPNKILNAWSSIVGNWCAELKDGWANRPFSNYVGDRVIDAFILINGISAFKVSSCSIYTHYLKAEGFKEFMDNYNKPVKDTVGYDREFTVREGDVWRNGVTADYQQIEKVPALITIKKELLLDTEVNYTELVRTELIKPKKVVLF